MKKHYANLRWLLGCIFMLWLLNSCSSETAYVREDVKEVEEIAKFAPFNITIDHAKARVSFVQTPIPFEMDLSTDKHTSDIRLIEEVIGKDIPLKVFVYKGTNQIAKVLLGTEQDILDYRKDLVSIDSDIMNRPDPSLISIFPDEATLMSVFNMIVNNSCSNNNQAGCLTFQFATDGCNARAHKMKQILNSNGYNCQKHYIFGDLLASANSCCTQWIYHTAPLVLVRNSNNVVEERIIDPSLFSAPVTPEVWRAGCQNSVCVFNPNFEFGPTSYKTVPGIVFNYDPMSMSFRLDSDYFRTDCTLGVYQNQSGCSFPNPLPPENCQN
ncbi:protein-glutamine glutaminase family protein [Flavobacterium sp.]|uniref:protein-glutamine glutaminase family protein n=1 Tax=Flavobacterium sp. TaxID=239 RepID=UPI0026183143|nr:protein-glutamine glutaminase family protein [Flavobacterium sp.]